MNVAEAIEMLRRFPQNAEVKWQGRCIAVYTMERYGGRFDWHMDAKDEELPDWSKPDKENP